MKKQRYVYGVYCNKEPILYGMKSSKRAAMKYAQHLIDYRKPKTISYTILAVKEQIQYDLEHGCESTIFQVLLTCDNEYYDGCIVKVVQYPVR